MNVEDSLLVVDDDRSILSALRMILENDYRVFTAENGKEALELMAD